MPRFALHRPRVFVMRALGALTVFALGSLLATSCLSDFEFPPPPGGIGGFAPYPSHCGNGEHDGDESATDCGGSCEGCAVGQRCMTHRDCENPLAEDDPARAFCNDEKFCELDCPRDKGDCDSQAENGCEVDLLTDEEHCGACRAQCDLPNVAVELCMIGQCLIKKDEENQGCDPNYANCNLFDDDGCEINLKTNPDYCGECEDSACSDQNGVRSCTGGQCYIECSDGFADCDDVARTNGCEVNIAMNVNNCGTCGKICETDGPEFSANCQDGVCGQTECELGLGDCNGDSKCEDTLNTVTHCGACYETCGAPNAEAGCLSTGDGPLDVTCGITMCYSDDEVAWEDCDGQYETGCEVNTTSSNARCGGCLPSEGGSGRDCRTKVGEDHVAVTSCAGGGCTIVGCDAGWVDCNGDFDDGCEINTNTDEENCGACADAGGDVCDPRTNASNTCRMGSCEYECEAGWLDLNNDRYDLDSDGCESRMLEVVGPGVVGFFDTGANGGAPLEIEHTLAGAPGTERLILVGVHCRGTSVANCAITEALYGTTQLELLDEVFVGDTSVKLFYALDADLPGPGDHIVSLTRNNEWGSLGAEVIELSGAEQQGAFYADFGAAMDNANCDYSDGPVLTLEGLPRGSLVYAVGGGSAGNNQGQAAAGPPLSTSANLAGTYMVLGSGYSERLDGDVEAALNFTTCYQSAMVAVGIRPESNY